MSYNDLMDDDQPCCPTQQLSCHMSGDDANHMDNILGAMYSESVSQSHVPVQQFSFLQSKVPELGVWDNNYCKKSIHHPRWCYPHPALALASHFSVQNLFSSRTVCAE